MEQKLSEIRMCKFKKKSSTICTVESDIIVPDTKPDIYRILCINAVSDIEERYIRKDKIIFSGNIKFNIMYICEDDKEKIYNIESTSMFNHQADLSGASENAVSISKCTVSKTDYNIKNSRKLTCKGILNIDFDAIEYKDTEILEAVEGDDKVPFKSGEISCDKMVSCKECEFTFSDNIPMPNGNGTFEIYDMKSDIDIENIKTVNNKAIIKGLLPIKVFYSYENDLSIYETELSFTEISDLDMAGGESTLLYNFDICNIDYSVLSGSDNVSVDIDIKIKGSIIAYDSCKHMSVTDIYSPDYSYSIKKEEAYLEKYHPLNQSQLTVKDSISVRSSSDSISKVHYMNVYPSCSEIKKEGSSLKVKGEIQNTVIYSSEDGSLFGINKISPFESEIMCDFDYEDCICNAHICALNYGYVLNSSQDIALRTVIKIIPSVQSMEKVSVITDFKEDETSPADKSNQPSIIVCYPDSQSNLWDYAVKYNTTVDEIAYVNNIDSSSDLIKGKPIIIPKRVVQNK